jgi:hypothetical protein
LGRAKLPVLPIVRFLFELALKLDGVGLVLVGLSVAGRRLRMGVLLTMAGAGITVLGGVVLTWKLK